ncbi:hypothetical protein [Streptomyces sp. NRRL B-24720]|uniref:hypothetical protein n=1 Tax=Streptomyces sp. NRRL B-24720 TaxID=1476876 RepID=UPI0004C88094|nr:hypothetical protein [Streptomyces sp. NRRL B-24720]
MVVRRLLAVDESALLMTLHVRIAAGVSERMVWRWLSDASHSKDAAVRPGSLSAERFEITGPIRVLLTY